MEFLDKEGLRVLWAQINNLVSSSGGGGGGSASEIPVLDLGDVSSIGSSVNLTSNQVTWINNNYNKVSAIKFSDNSEAGGTMPLLLSQGSYQERSFYYSGIYFNTIYYMSLDMNDYSGAATSGTYYIQKTNIGSGGGGSEPSEQEAMFSGQYYTWHRDDSSSQSFNLDTSTVGLTQSKIETLEFTFSASSQSGFDDTYNGTIQIGINELYNLYNAGTVSSMNSLKLFGGKLELTIDSISANYDQGTLNYSISANLRPNWSKITQNYSAGVSTGFTYKGFKFANGSSY